MWIRYGRSSRHGDAIRNVPDSDFDSDNRQNRTHRTKPQDRARRVVINPRWKSVEADWEECDDGGVPIPLDYHFSGNVGLTPSLIIDLSRLISLSPSAASSLSPFSVICFSPFSPSIDSFTHEPYELYMTRLAGNVVGTLSAGRSTWVPGRQYLCTCIVRVSTPVHSRTRPEAGLLGPVGPIREAIVINSTGPWSSTEA